ncbi:MAG TPA: hypoxanthine phosphoribosyltransferase [Anaerolineales bacterium]|nr:hypoxanthine phosphoribosyltransferase [Anaerolineales bacterium]
MVANYRDLIREIMIDEDRLNARIAELGAEISADYAGQDLLLVCILTGGVLFLADLMRKITVPHQIDFMAVSSYGSGGRQSTGHVRINFDLKTDIYNRNVLLVEDIIDSGYTLNTVIDMLQTRQPRSLRICTLLDKVERREVAVTIDYCGFRIADEFVFGYGLDIDEYYRNLPFIAAVDLSKYTPEE